MLAYFDCFSGISGDMILGALLDSGLDFDDLQADLRTLPIDDYELRVERVDKLGVTATHVAVTTAETSPHRHLHHIEEIIQKSSLPDIVQQRALAAFRRLAEAEAKVHGTTIQKVHFHEVGAVDAIVDVVGCFAGLHRLGVEDVWASPLHVGAGFVECAHGRYPVPAPGTLNLLAGVPIYSTDVRAELVTPTGACLITSLASRFGPLPTFIPERIGYGAGTRDLPIPNVLRLVLGKPGDTVSPPEGYRDWETDQIEVLETNVDDMNPEFFPHVVERLQAAGALDVYVTPVVMKRGRPGQLLTVLAPLGRTPQLSRIISEETTSLGIRLHRRDRLVARRDYVQVSLPEGDVKVKIGYLGQRIVNLAPELSECECLARQANEPLKDVYLRAQLAAARILEIDTPV